MWLCALADDSVSLSESYFKLSNFKLADIWRLLTHRFTVSLHGNVYFCLLIYTFSVILSNFTTGARTVLVAVPK